MRFPVSSPKYWSVNISYTGNKFAPAFEFLTFPEEKKKQRLPEATSHRRASPSPDRLHPSTQLKTTGLFTKSSRRDL